MFVSKNVKVYGYNLITSKHSHFFEKQTNNNGDKKINALKKMKNLYFAGLDLLILTLYSIDRQHKKSP
jgi:hypothetical protein